MLSVYVIGPTKAKPVKIGYARKATRRLKELQIGWHEELHLWHETEMLTLKEAKRLELATHKAFADRHIRGEWFDVDANEVATKLGELIDLRVYAARTLMRFDVSPYIEPSRFEKIREVALRTIDNNAIC